MSTNKRVRRARKSKRHVQGQASLTRDKIVSALLKTSQPEQKQTMILLPGLQTLSASGATSIAVERNLNVVTDSPAYSNFQVIFSEYRVLWIKVQIIPISISAGYTQFWFTESAGGTPTSTLAQNKQTDAYSNNSSACSIKRFEGTQSPHYIKMWKPADITDPNWLAISTSYNKCYLSMFGATSTHGTPGSTSLWVTRAWYYVSFRGRN